MSAPNSVALAICSRGVIGVVASFTTRLSRPELTDAKNVDWVTMGVWLWNRCTARVRTMTVINCRRCCHTETRSSYAFCRFSSSSAWVLCILSSSSCQCSMLSQMNEHTFLRIQRFIRACPVWKAPRQQRESLHLTERPGWAELSIGIVHKVHEASLGNRLERTRQ